MSNLVWKKWDGRIWDGNPDALVHVRFGDGADTDAAGVDPVVARHYGVDPKAASNWVRGFGPRSLQIVEYAIVEKAE